MNAPRPLLTPVMSGFACWRIGLILDKELPAAIEALQAGGAHPALVGELRQAWASVTAAGEAWQEWRAAIAASGNAEVADAAVGGDSEPEEITTGEAAVLLRLGERRVRQLLDKGALTGRRVGRAWLVSRLSVLALREVRRVA